MAQLAIGLAVGAAGQSVGIPFGVGFAAGNMLAGILLPSGDKPEERPQLTDFEIQSSAYGRSIPKMYGTIRLAGSITDAGTTITKTFEESQGKGDLLAGPTTTHTEQFITFAVLICEGEVDLLRIWADKKLIVDLTGGGVPNIEGLNYTFYRGTETQNADPRLQAIHGATKTPAYRGWAYILFEEFPLTRFGNRIPNLEFEVTSNATTTFPAGAITLPSSPWKQSSSSDGIVNWALDPINPFVYGIGRSDEPVSAGYGLAKYDALTGALISWNGETTASIISAGNTTSSVEGVGLAVDRLGFIYMGVSSLDGLHENVVKINPNSLTSIDFVPGSIRTLDWNDIKVGHLAVPGGTLEITDGVLQQVAPFGPFITHVKNGGAEFAIDWGGGTPAGIISIPMGNMINWTKAGGDWSGDDIFDFVFDPFGRMWAVGDSTLRLFILTHDPFDPRLNVVLLQSTTYDLSGYGTGFALISYDEATHSLIIGNVADPLGGSPENEWPLLKFDLVDKVVTSTFPDLAWFSDAPHTQNVWDYGVFRNWIDGTFALKNTDGGIDKIYVIDTVLETITVLTETNYSLTDFGSNQIAWNTYTNCAWANNDDIAQAPYEICMPRKAGSPVTLRSIVEAISADVGLVVDTDTAMSALTDTVRGFIIESRMPARAAIEALQPGFLFSVVESDWTLTGVKAGGASSVTIPEDDLGARPDPDGSVEKLPSKRIIDRDLPRQVDVSYFNVNDDYQLGNEHAERISGAIGSTELKTVRLPIVFTPDEAATVATRLLYLAWANRVGYSLNLTHAHALIDPSDVIGVTKGGSTFEMRVTEARLGANMIVQLDAVSEDSGVFSISAVAEAETGFVAQTIDRPGPTELYLMDIALLREQDDDHGFYLATTAKTESSSWTGAVVAKSSDAVAFSHLITTNAQPAAGFAQAALADQPRWTVWDDDNTVDVIVPNGTTLESKTDVAILAFANMALLGNEIIQFGTATQIGGNLWRLSHLLRGRMGSESFTGGHAAGDRFVMLGFTTIYNITLPQSELNATRYYRARTIGQATSFPDDIKTHANTAVRRKPYAPAYIQGSRSGGDLVITWLRRSRIPGPDLHDSPLFEAVEEYEIDILDPVGSPTVTRTLTASGEAVSYTEAQQAADFGSPTPASVGVIVYQMNATVGRGYGGSATL